MFFCNISDTCKLQILVIYFVGIYEMSVRKCFFSGTYQFTSTKLVVLVSFKFFRMPFLYTCSEE